MSEPAPVVLEVKNLQTRFFTPQGTGKAVDGVDFRVHRGETFGIVGESGCGKSITALSILRLVPRENARIVAGEVLFRGVDVLRLSEGEMRKYRGRRISLILQDPMSALNPVLSIGNQLIETLRLHRRGGRGRSLREKAVALLKLLRVPAAESRLSSYPHEFSGGMCPGRKGSGFGM
jgi:ABC-type dipeptide/oligopeptide/nickel transport system ATPase component